MVFNGSDDPATTIALFGADHLYAPYDYWKDIDGILLSEAYEFALSLAPAAVPPVTIAHLQSIKLYRAITLAESGYRTEAQKYCDAITSILKSSTKPSPYFHPPLFRTLENLTTRISQSPKDIAGARWLSKPSLDGISGSMWGAFTKFVAGEDNEGGVPGADNGSGDLGGPFGKMTPAMSRSQSTADIYGGYPAPVVQVGGGGYSPPGGKGSSSRSFDRAASKRTG